MSELTVLIASGAAIVTAIVGFVTAIIARIDNGRHWKAVDDAMRREAEYAKERDTATKALLSSDISSVSRRVEDFIKSLGERFDAQSQMIGVKFDALESKVENNFSKQESALRSAESNLALKVELGQSQTATKLGELRTAIEAKADITTKYLVERLSTEISSLQTNNQKLEEQQKRIFGLFKKRGRPDEPLGDPATQE